MAFLLLTSAAQTQGGYELAWWTVDGDGRTSSSAGGYDLGGTIGQPDAGVLTGGGYTLAGDFWGGGAPPPEHVIYLPLIMRDH